MAKYGGTCDQTSSWLLFPHWLAIPYPCEKPWMESHHWNSLLLTVSKFSYSLSFDLSSSVLQDLFPHTLPHSSVGYYGLYTPDPFLSITSTFPRCQIPPFTILILPYLPNHFSPCIPWASQLLDVIISLQVSSIKGFHQLQLYSNTDV